MKIYFAGYTTIPEIVTETEADNFLESFLYFRKKDYGKWHQEQGYLGKNLFLDSGAYSAFSRGEKIDLDEYIEFIKNNKQHIKTYAGLDVIGDWQATRKNIEYMEAHGLQPLPTFHVGSPLTELHRLCDKYDYIALGGLVPLATQRVKMESWLNTCFSVIKDYWPVKVHGFGVNSFWSWKKYPFYSVDATSWLAGMKFRQVVLFKDGKLIQKNKQKEENDLWKMKVHESSYRELNLTNARSYMEAADFVTRVWEQRGIKFTD